MENNQVEDVDLVEQDIPNVEKKEVLPHKEELKKDKETKDIDFSIPPDVAQSIAALWRKGLLYMKQLGCFDGEIPEFFIAECLSDGGLTLRVIHMPKGIVSVGFPSKVDNSSDFSVFGQERKQKSEGHSTNLRKLSFDDDGSVSVIEK